jgi:Ser/Thr protein kinase RdoA (MazF antagonist)
MERHGEWDMQYCHENIESRIYSVADLELRKKLLTTATAMQNRIDTFKSEIRKQVIHGDLAYYNGKN